MSRGLNVAEQMQASLENSEMMPKRPLSFALLFVVFLSSTSVKQVAGEVSAQRRNVLYIVVDDLRPELPSYGHTHIHAPNTERLAQRGLLFNRAYCQQSVCAPSRMSFMTGRTPKTTRSSNFINHFRQADCGLEKNGVAYKGEDFQVIKVEARQGGAGQCCTFCTYNAQCRFWTYNVTTSSCHIKQGTSGDAYSDPDSISGTRGTPNSWTSLPENFLKQGYLVMGTGKLYHPDESGLGPPYAGPGLPPLADPPSWTNDSVQYPSWANYTQGPQHYVIPPMLGCPGKGHSGCAINCSESGEDANPPLCDKVIADDAIAKLKHAAQQIQQSNKPFFLAVGFRKPHLAWRFPAPFLKYYDGVNNTALPKQKTMDMSVPPIAYHSPSFGAGDPYIAIDDGTSRLSRLQYYASVSWMDSQLGRVLDELTALELDNNTLIAFHSDHGWHLGEHGEWRKFTNWELGARVPLIISVPWMAGSHGQKTNELVELVDVYQTLSELAGVDLPSGEKLEGTSLVPLLNNPALTDFKPYALSQYPRCPSNMSVPWRNNWCEFVERTRWPVVGFSMRTKQWRYTEWPEWNGTSMTPVWANLHGVELYNHDGDDGTDFDAFENVNLASQPKYKETVKELSQQLHSAFGYPD